MSGQAKPSLSSSYITAVDRKELRWLGWGKAYLMALCFFKHDSSLYVCKTMEGTNFCMCGGNVEAPTLKMI